MMRNKNSTKSKLPRGSVLRTLGVSISQEVLENNIAADPDSALPISMTISSALFADIPILSSKKQNTTCFVVVLSFLSAIGGFLFGYDTGVVSGAVILLKDSFQLSSLWQEAVISVTLATAALSAILSGYTNDRFGRRPTILTSSVVFTVGAVILGAAIDRWMLIIGRAILGIGIGSYVINSLLN